MKNDTVKSTESSGFQEMGVHADLVKILNIRGITKPTPIQQKAIPLALQGKDLIGIAQTGTGKTFAFGLPLLHHLANGKKRALIVLPTRELAYQVDDALKPFAAALGIKTAVFVGGSPMYLQKKALKTNPRILVATPGRLNDHLTQKTVTLREVEILVLDEADRMLDMGFKPQINKILSQIPRERQTLLFSATMPQGIVQLATSQMSMPLRIEVAQEGTTAAKINQELIIVKQPDKLKLLITLLREYDGKVIVFCRTKHGTKKITKALNDEKLRAAEIHGNRTLAQRRAALEGFKRGTHRVLVATDVASRGIDVSDIEVVMNYDLPDDAADYVHRIGRTARAGKEGKAISFATPTQAGHIRDIEKLIRTPINRVEHKSVPTVSMERGSSGNGRPPRRGSGGRSGSPRRQGASDSRRPRPGSRDRRPRR